MAEMTPKLKALIKKHLPARERDACWQHPKSRKWIIYHWALALIAREEEIEYGKPEVLECRASDGVVSLLIQGTMPEPTVGELKTAYAFGEASPKNNTNSYPLAMAFKRGQDIVALDLLDLRGEVYSDIEADDFKEPERSPERPQPEPAPQGLPDPGPAKTPYEVALDFQDAASNAAEAGDAAKLRELWRDVGDALKAGELRDAEAKKLRQFITKLGKKASKS